MLRSELKMFLGNNSVLQCIKFSTSTSNTKTNFVNKFLKYVYYFNALNSYMNIK